MLNEGKLPMAEAGKAGRVLIIAVDDPSGSCDSEGAEVCVIALRGART
jgi:hypothetical protein